jgi:hypothetical protein
MERSESGFNAGVGSDDGSFSSSSLESEQTNFESSGSAGGFQSSGTPSASAGESSSSESGVKGRVRNVASSVRDKASNIPSIIADGLERGANALRQNRGTSGDSASGAASGSSMALANDPSIAAVTDTLASGMQSSAEWLRDADIDKIKSDVEKQVKEHPGRTLLIALGAGYLLGKAFRR